MMLIPFLTYKLLPSQSIIIENIRSDHVKEDIDTLIYLLTPILFLTKTGVPKPPFLDPSVIQHLTDKPGTLNLLQLLGWLPNNRGDYVFVNANTSEETNRREEVANEFRQFYNELKKIKENDITSIENSHAIITTVPFSSYRIVPAENIIRNNVNIEHIKEDLDAMIHTLTPVLYVTKTGVPKPPFLDPSIIQQLTDKPGTLNVLPLFGCTPNNRGDYIFIDANTPQEIALRETAANEFRQFYDELKKVKNGNMMIIEYFLNHPNNGSIHI